MSVGVETSTIRVPLGHFEGEIHPGGLRNTPVVVVAEPSVERVIEAGVQRTGGASTATAAARDAAVPLGASLFEAAGRAEVGIVVAEGAEAAAALRIARALGGRPLPVLAFEDRLAARAIVDGCAIDLDVALPSVDGPLRYRIRELAAELDLFSDHHVVEVDPRPALAGHTSRGIDGVPMLELAAAAAGVLAGRIAAGNRRWR
ncbi:MAG: hypothetical protein ACRDHI_10860 [Actinomycetota bacterium]